MVLNTAYLCVVYVQKKVNHTDPLSRLQCRILSYMTFLNFKQNS